jgi:hypothetical protein
MFDEELEVVKNKLPGMLKTINKMLEEI